MAHSYDVLISEIEKLQAELQHAERAARAADHFSKRVELENSRINLQMKTLQTLSMGLFSTLEVKQMYALVCETLVYQLGWDSAFAITLKGSRPLVLASFQATLKQQDHIRDYLGQTPAFMDAYASRNVLSTFTSSDKEAISLKVLFQTDHVVAVPVLFGQKLYAYLVICSHTLRSKNRGLHDLDFLSALATHVAHAVQNGENFQNLEQQNLKLRELDDLKDSFISITSHQLRTPLSIIKWTLSILQSDKEMIDLPKQQRMIDQAYESNERLIHVVNDLLNVSRIEDGKLPFTPQLVSMVTILQDLAVGTAKTCANRGLHFECNAHTDIPAIQLDPLLFKQALQGMLDNAIDYNKEGGWVKITALTTPKEIQVLVSNSGQGISKETQRKIFDQFYRSPEAVKIQPSGNGLGLYLARAVVRQHGGEITCESTINHQTTFIIHLPLPNSTS